MPENKPEAPWGVMRSRIPEESRPWLVYNAKTPLGEEDRFETFDEAMDLAFSNATDELTWEEIAARTLLHASRQRDYIRPFSVFLEQDARKILERLV